jgi:DNA-binding Lrp family transcriptional regulator
MDKIDEKILAELDKNPRTHLTQLAKKCRVSQQVADYRIKRMIENKTITKFGAIVNLKALGLEHYRVFFTFNAKRYSYEEILNYLENEKEIYWSCRIGGKYDLLIVLFVKDFEGFDKFIDNFNKAFPGLVKDYKSCYVISHELYKHKYLSHDSSFIQYGYNDAIKKIDDLDRYILSEIKDNCRVSALKLSEGKEISYKTVINRIKALEKQKIILGYRIFLKSEEKKPYIILFSFRDYSKKIENDLLTYLRNHKQITQIARLFGVWNLFIHIRAENNEEIQKLLIELRDKFEIIDNYETIPLFEDISINLMPS